MSDVKDDVYDISYLGWNHWESSLRKLIKSLIEIDIWDYLVERNVTISETKLDIILVWQPYKNCLFS